MFSRPKILFLVSLLFVALLNSIPTYLLNFYFFIILVNTLKESGINIRLTTKVNAQAEPKVLHSNYVYCVHMH